MVIRRRALAAWAALCAIALGAAWPYFAPAKAGEVFTTVCTAEGTRLVDASAGGSSSGQHGAAPKHCAWCVAGSSPAVASAPLHPPMAALPVAAVPPALRGEFRSVSLSDARPRAPPAAV